MSTSLEGGVPSMPSGLDTPESSSNFSTFWNVSFAQWNNRHNSTQDEQTHNAHVHYTQNDHSTHHQTQRQLQVNQRIDFLGRFRRRVKCSAK